MCKNLMKIFNCILTTNDVSLSSSSRKFKKRLIVFSPWCYGHYPTYLRHLIFYWCHWQLSETLNIVVSGQFLEEHADVVELQKKYDDRQSIQFVAITAGGILEIIEDRVTGLLVPLQNPSKMAEAILWIINNPEQAKHMSEVAQLKAKERFSIEKQVFAV
jgi:glycosyltransferase involved in cell wall biosynthesis